MKRLAIVLSVIILLALFSPGFSIFAQPVFKPHENPAEAKRSPDLTALIVSYSNIFNLAAIRQYQDAQSLLKELEQTNIPDGIRYTVDSYNTLSRNMLNTLNNAESFLDKASTLFANNQLSDAKKTLDDAGAAIHDARFQLEDIEAATNTMADNLGILAASASSQTKQAHEHLKENLQRTRQLTDELNQLRESLELNPLTEIKTSFYHTTSLKVSAPETAYPGLPISISGQVSSTDGNIDRTIKILLDDTQLTEETVQGQFSLEITPPPQTSTGKHSLTVMATPLECYSGTLKRLGIDISRIPLQTNAKAPQLVIIPETIQVSGKVSHNLAPVQDAQVNLAFRQSSATTKTATDGSFTASIDAPLDLSLIGPQELTITIEALEPWYVATQIETQIFVINPANTGLMLVAFLSLGLLVYNRVRTRVPRPQEEKGVSQPQARELTSVTPPPRPKDKLTGIRGRILSAYISGLEAVEKITGIPMAPHITLREFFKAATLRLPTAIKLFAKLTTIAEVALYSAHRPDKNIATKAEKLAATIKEELHSGPA